MSELPKNRDDHSFELYQVLRENVETMWRDMSAQDLLQMVSTYSLSENLMTGIKREIRAIYYLSKWKPKWEFQMSNSIDDLTGVDITAWKNSTDEFDNLIKATFQVGGIKPDMKALSGVDYYIQVTKNKIYVHKLV